ncbi:unnamed protein product [Musa textilis]
MRRRPGILRAAALLELERRGDMWVPSHLTRDDACGAFYTNMSVVMDDAGISLSLPSP